MCRERVGDALGKILGRRIAGQIVECLFFKPAGGFSTAEEFCNGQLWLPDDRLTYPLFAGNIDVQRES